MRDQFLNVAGLNAGHMACSGLAPVPFARPAGKDFRILERRMTFNLDAAPRKVHDPRRRSLRLAHVAFQKQKGKARPLGLASPVSAFPQCFARNRLKERSQLGRFSGAREAGKNKLGPLPKCHGLAAENGAFVELGRRAIEREAGLHHEGGPNPSARDRMCRRAIGRFAALPAEGRAGCSLVKDSGSRYQSCASAGSVRPIGPSGP
jgi:hypothetical protein